MGFYMLWLKVLNAAVEVVYLALSIYSKIKKKTPKYKKLK